MKTFGVVMGCIVVILGIIAFTLFGIYQNRYDTANGFESSIKAQDKSSQNALSTHILTTREKVQVPAMYAEDFEKLYKTAITARYGEDGSKAMFQFIKEHNPNFDSKLYLDLQAGIEAGRKDFRAAQDLKLDQCRNYETFRNSLINSIVLGFTKFPSPNIDHLCQVVTDADTQVAFDTGKQEAIKLR